MTIIVSVIMGYYANKMVSEKLAEHDRIRKMQVEMDEESQSLLDSNDL